MSDDYLWDRSGEPDPDVARLEQALAPLRHDDAWRGPPRSQARSAPAEPPAAPDPGARRARIAVWAAGGALALAASVAIALGVLGAGRGAPDRTAAAPPFTARPTASPAPASPCETAATGFPFKADAPVLCGGAPLAAGNLPAGVWLETPAGKTADLRVADIGSILLNAGSKLRIVETSAREHRLELVKGSLHATVVAPPRLFVIDTRAATAVDLGCAYDLSVDDRGATHLRVLKGEVSLEGKGRAVIVPRRTSVTADPDRGPGAVIADTASEPLRAAAAGLDAGDATALVNVLKHSAAADSATLWNLLANASSEARPMIAARIDELKLRPAKISREALAAGKPEALQALRDHLEDAWYAE